MDFRTPPIIILLACLAVAGCHRRRAHDIYLELLNAEKRVLEDRLYEAEDNYQRALRELKACHAREADAEPPPAAPRKPPPRPEEPPLPEIEFPPGFGDSFGASSDTPPIRLATLGVPENAQLPPDRNASADQRLDPPPVDQRVVAITLDPAGTGAMDLDGSAGDDALSVLIKPRNELEQYVAKPGRVNIVLLDPAAGGEAARVAQWEFDAQATDRMLSTGRFVRGIHVRVPLPDLSPDTDRLHLFVRYTDDDGRSVEADRIIEVRAVPGAPHRWTPRADGIRDDAASTPRSPRPAEPRPSNPPEPLTEAPRDFWKPHR